MRLYMLNYVDTYFEAKKIVTGKVDENLRNPLIFYSEFWTSAIYRLFTSIIINKIEISCHLSQNLGIGLSKFSKKKTPIYRNSCQSWFHTQSFAAIYQLADSKSDKIIKNCKIIRILSLTI